VAPETDAVRLGRGVDVCAAVDAAEVEGDVDAEAADGCTTDDAGDSDGVAAQEATSRADRTSGAAKRNMTFLQQRRRTSSPLVSKGPSTEG
jgi:hypothetical protein